MRHIRKFGGAKVKLSAEARGGNEVVGGLIHCKDRVRDINSYGNGSETKILPACIHLNDKNTFSGSLLPPFSLRIVILPYSPFDFTFMYSE